MKAVNLIFPHQLFKDNPLLANGHQFYLVEEWLFFRQYAFHKQKLAFHRMSMRYYAEYLKETGASVQYVEAREEISDVRKLIPFLKENGVEKVFYIDPTDNWLEKRLLQGSDSSGIQLESLGSPLFLNSREDLSKFFKKDKKKFFQTSFYKSEREKRGILMEAGGVPAGGKWTYDVDNRKKYPAKKQPPSVQYPEATPYFEEALEYVARNFADNPGQLDSFPHYPHTHEQSMNWFHQFLDFRFAEFGPYEDAMVKSHDILHHSVLTPMLNVGLLTPQEVLDKAIAFAEENDVPLNSTEGFVRQIMGWREFIRGMYECKGSYERSLNFWGFNRKITPAFYTGNTGIGPLDEIIRRVLRTGYCHHIERLMVLGNFMLLCEFDPDEVYRWFMELFIDAYDWVMVPNVYGMSQFADGGLMATKPYISSSNYILKMSDFDKREWQEIWDALFWRFMHVNRDFFLSNPRLGMLVRTFDKMSEDKKRQHLERAEAYLTSLDT
ncbi:cryptochrome/photolyase family protein [Poritiphilus flavus]|uniref:Cryptochrome/photolyase family protein n=1 Tax=Poritiphilus flavus TaxID=2697053 RepID=A0A6L9EC17_9FLAO|nr:cryptochrome/photolyase family protein [Poritiphilus flavus]NAS12131.1 cryptochrome/photolyase family protein [Poritiphilus flavus]